MDEHVAITLAIDGFQDIDDKSPLDTIICKIFGGESVTWH
jgi:hypothetical protein